MLLWLKAILLPYENPEHPLYCPPRVEQDDTEDDEALRSILGDKFVDRMNNP